MSGALLEGKITLITGAASGIGRASATVFAGHGAKVALTDINARGGEETAEMVRKAGGEASSSARTSRAQRTSVP